MKRFLPLLVLPLLLAGCGPMLSALGGFTPPPAPVAVADKTVIDEQAGLAVTLAYEAASQLAITANRAGLLDTAAKARVRDLDNRAFAAVQSVRRAYLAGNATSYGAALVEARAAIADILTSVKGG